MKRAGLAIAVAVGLAVATGAVAVVGFGAVAAALERIGWRGLAVLIGSTAVPLALLGGAWFVLTPGAPARDLPALTWARMARDAGGELLPFSPLGGWVIGARSAILAGIEATGAYSTTLVDVTCELIAQLGFTAMGLALLAVRLGSGALGGPVAVAVAAGLALLAVGAGAFVILQKRSAPLIEALGRRFSPPGASQAGLVARALATLYERPGRIAAGVALHLIAWIASAATVWLALRAAGIAVPFAGVLAIESLVTAARSAVVVAPMGIGVQEGAYALIGPLFGLGPELALAVSLVKRARDVALGLPCLIAWQSLEGGRLLARRPGLARSDGG